MKICDRCRAEFNMARVKADINRHWGPGRYEYVQRHSGTLCEDCCTDYLYCEDEDGNPIDPKDIVYPD